MPKNINFISTIAVLLFVTYPTSNANACMGDMPDVVYTSPPENELYFAKNIEELITVAYPGHLQDKYDANKYSIKMPNKVENPAVTPISFNVNSSKNKSNLKIIDFYAHTKVKFTESSEWPNVINKAAFYKVASFKLSPEFGGELSFRMRGTNFTKPSIYAVIRKEQSEVVKNVVSWVHSDVPELWGVCGPSTVIVYTHNKALQTTPKSGAPEF